MFFLLVYPEVAAVRTGKRPFSNVDLQVHLQLGLVGEPHLTLRTAVDPLMDLHLLGAAEAFVTEHAEEPFLFTTA
jgi:hypothetical protein